MANYNKVILLGNLTRDPQLRYLPNQTAIVDFGLAINRKWKDAQGAEREDVLFIDCTAFGRPAEVISQYCHKGNPLFIEGRLKLDQWEDKNGGGKRSKHGVLVESFQLMGQPTGQGTSPAPTTSPARAAMAEKRKQADDSNPISEDQHFLPDDIPF